MALARDFLPPTAPALPRRAFLKLAGIAGGGLALGIGLAPLAGGQETAAAAADLNAYVQIRPDGKIRIYAPNPEVGQGVKTSLPLIVAEELDAAWADVVVEQSPIDRARFGSQVAGGSRTTPTRWTPLRQVGAAARAMLVAAAAQKWGVDAATLTTADSAVRNPATGATLTYAELADAAAKLAPPAPETLRLKTAAERRLLGKRYTGVDNRAIVTGRPLFGIDQSVPGMAYATYVRAPRLGSTVKSANVDEVKTLPGVHDVLLIEGLAPNSRSLVPGVAIIAESTWAAFQAARRLQVDWDVSGASTDSSSAWAARAKELGPQPAETTLAETGDVDAALAGAAQTLEAFYDYPWLYHSPLEPMNCTASYADGKLTLWAPTQAPTAALGEAAQACGIAPEDVTLHQTRVGGGFGRRLAHDFVAEAAAISKAAGRPVKLTYTREDDTTHALYRPAGFHHLEGGLTADGKLAAWRDHFITFLSEDGTVQNPASLPAGEFPMYALENVRLEQSAMPAAARPQPFRAPRSNGIAFVTQSFFHELSVAAGRDHKEFLLELLGEPRELTPPRAQGGPPPAVMHTGRMRNVIEAACGAAGWGRPMPAGSGLGLAFYYSHQGHIAEVVEVSVDAAKKVKVHKVWAAADVGPIVNRSAAENQCQGAVIDGVGIAASLAITFEGGAVQQTNFHQYPLPRLPSAPEIEVIFLDTDYSPTGLGEPTLPPVIPALCNAIYAATGERIRSLPFSKQGFTI